MTFSIERASVTSDTQPCPEAYPNLAEEHWVLDINTFEEFLNFVKREKKVIFEYYEGEYSIIIYDDYVE
jgi:hypothetical protein